MNEDSLDELHVYKESLEQQMAPPGMVSCCYQYAVMLATCYPHAGMSLLCTQQDQCTAVRTVSIYFPTVLLSFGNLCSADRQEVACAFSWSLSPAWYPCHKHAFAVLQALNEDGCMLAAKIVWITLMETRSVRRWAACKPDRP